jgi:hypothetical protein
MGCLATAEIWSEAMRLDSCSIDRRHLLQWAAGAGALIAAHQSISCEPLTASQNQEPAMHSPLIRSLQLLSSAPLVEMKSFYHQLLGLPVLAEQPDRLTIAAGQTSMTFLNAKASGGLRPFYHFAFNIPENKILAAHRWQSRRTELLPIPPSLRDPQFPDDVVHYRHWNAHSIFFFDPSGNVVEYIARHDLPIAAEGEFDSSDILCASEIAFVVDDVSKMTAYLRTSLDLPPYRTASEQFAALGDERGLLLVMQRGRLISFLSPRQMAVDVFATAATIGGKRSATLAVPEFPYAIAVQV